MKQVYKITYPTGKIYIGKDSYGSARYMGSPDRNLINADFESLPDDVRLDYTLRKQILWESDTACEPAHPRRCSTMTPISIGT